MRILALNSGSSSIKCALIDSAAATRLFEFRVENIGASSSHLITATGVRELGALTYESAIAVVLAEVRQREQQSLIIEAVVHRIVHGGNEFTQPTVVNDAVVEKLAKLSVLAPLHNPPALAMLRAAQKDFANVPHVAVFDTAFHTTLPTRAREYALPRALAEKYSLRRYGFHGLSHAYVMHAVANHLKTTPQQLRIISCHLGNGASVAAIEYGRSVETSMGMTPLEGLVMGTRCGDIDPGILLRLLESKEFDAAALDHLLNSESGLVGLAGTFDFAAIEKRAAQGDEGCRRAITLYTHRIRKYIGAYAAVMGGVDAIAFTGGVGEHSALVRHRASQRFDYLGAAIDEDRNRDLILASDKPVADLSSDISRVRILAVRADEETQMANEAATLLSGSVVADKDTGANTNTDTETDLHIPVAVSARHFHPCVATLEQLFGKGYQLAKHSDLSQHGQFSAQETVTIIGPRGRIEHVRLMGPPRKDDQVEISRSDEFLLGVDAPVRLSGDLDNTPGITIEGPLGRVTIPKGVICARRHIHMNPADAQRLGLHDHDSVAVKIDSEGRDLIFDDVIVRIAPDFQLELHLDTDEANAAGVMPHQQAELLARIPARAAITSRRIVGSVAPLQDNN